MNLYYGTKTLRATTMTRGAYNDYRGWDAPEDEDQSVDGYLVEYTDGGEPNHPSHTNYISWSPKEVFEASYQRTNQLNFGHAVMAMKNGHRLTRAGWNGKNMFVYYVPPADYPADRNGNSTLIGEFPNDMVPYRDYIAMYTVQGTVVPWVASQTDILAEDWVVVK